MAKGCIKLPTRLSNVLLATFFCFMLSSGDVLTLLIGGVPSVYTVPLNYDSVSGTYYLEASVGTPGQKFFLAYDTGAHFIAIPGPHPNNSEPTRKFEPNASSTYVKLRHGMLEYPRPYGKIEGGDYAFEVLKFGPITMKHPIQFSIDIIKFKKNAKFDGIFGLNAFIYDEGRPPTSWRLYKQKIIPRPMFTEYLAANPADGGYGGALTFGGVDETNCQGNINYTETDPNFNWDWLIKLSSISVNGEIVEFTESSIASLDSSERIISGSEEVMDGINTLVGIVGKDYKVDCNDVSNLLPVKLAFSNYQVTMYPKDYISERVDENGARICETVFRRTEEFNPSIVTLGIPFLRMACTVFEYNEDKSINVGFKALRIA